MGVKINYLKKKREKRNINLARTVKSFLGRGAWGDPPLQMGMGPMNPHAEVDVGGTPS